MRTEFIKISLPRNLPDENGFGKVDYEYEIGKYEVTNDEYCAFLNNIGERAELLGLFCPLMQQHFFCGIEKIDTPKDGVYFRVKKGYGKKPACGVTWNAAIKYINWLNYNSSKIESGIPVSEFTPYVYGDDRNGAYNNASKTVCRNNDAIYWLPNRDEWLKAAFFDGKNWHGQEVGNGANIYIPAKGWAYPYPHVKDVDEGVAPNFNGICDMQGNVAEWVENSQGDWRLAYGGSLIRTKDFAFADKTEGDSPDKSIASFGFRVCRSDDGDKRKNVEVPAVEPLPASSIEITPDRFVKVGYAGNCGDAQNQFKGRVNYDFMISRTQLTNDEYCEFLNAVAAISDPFHLFNENMHGGALGGIVKVIADDGKCRYAVKENWGQRPVVYVAFYDIARYCNWLHYGKPIGEQQVGTTEGDCRHGAYDTSDFEAVRSGAKKAYLTFGFRNIGARYWIPNDDEWYKAAYFDPIKIGTTKYHNYPMRTSRPSQLNANFMADNRLANDDGYFLAEVERYADYPSYFGTLQQGGNVWEWIESWQYGIVGSRTLRGGSFSYTEFGLNAINEDPGGIDGRSYVFGARICKSVDDNGFHPIKDPMTYRLYKRVMLLSPKRLVAAMAFIAFIIAIMLLLIFILV